MTINCIVVEDEPMAMKKLTGFIHDIPFLNLIAQFDQSLEALNYLATHTVDLLFLDIHMDKLSGIQLLESLPSPPQVIFTTAYSQYALKGYELKAIDYLLKPYSFERLVQAANKAKDQITTISPLPAGTPEIIFIKTAYQIERVKLNEIKYIEGMKDYLGIITDKRIMCLQSFKAILNILPAKDFIRVHKSYIVSLNHIESISNHLIKIGDKLIPVSDSYKEQFYAALQNNRGLL